MKIFRWKTLSAAVAVLGLLASSVTASPGDVWSLSGNMSTVSNPTPPVDPGAAGGGTGTWTYHFGGAPDIFGNLTTPINYTSSASGNLVGVVNPEMPDAGDGWYNASANHIALIKFSVDSDTVNGDGPDNTDFLAGNVGGHADTGTTWTTDHAGTFQIDYLGYNARANNAGGLVNMFLIDPDLNQFLSIDVLNPTVPPGGQFQGIANAVHNSQVLTLAAGESVRLIMTNNDWVGMDMTITEIPEPTGLAIASLAAIGLGLLRRRR